MKKRVLSLLLLLAMLVTMVPTMAVASSAETGEEELPRSETNVSEPISDYYSLYKTEGLVAFFDALDPTETLDLAEGKWYARVYNADTKKFEISETIFATVKGGAFDAEANPDGWQAYESGFGYADPNYTAAENVIEFDKQALLSYAKGPLFVRYSNWTVEALLNVTLRDVTDKDGRVENAFLFGPVGATHWTNLQTEDSDGGKGAVRWSIAPKSGSAAAPIYITAPGFTETQNSPSFNDYNGKIAPLTVSKVATDATGLASRYTVTHGAVVSTSRSDASKVDYIDEGLHILKNEQGTVYTVRVYASETGEALTAREAAANSAVDALIRLDVSLDVFNTLVEYEGLVERFLADVAPTLGVDATKENFETAIAEFVAREAAVADAKKLDDYEKLYVGADGSLTENGGKLVSLFAVTDATVDLTAGEWINKIGKVNASFGNPEKWAKRADGSVGYTGLYGQMLAGGFDKANASTASTNTIGSTMNYAYSNIHFKTRLNLGMTLLPEEDFTIEYVAKYNPIYVANPDGTIATDDYGAPIEYYNANGGQGISSAQYTAPLDHIGLISSWTVYRDGQYSSQMPARGDVIWMITDGTPKWGYTTPWVGSKPFTGGGGLLATGIREYGKVHTYVYTRDETLTLNGADRTVDAVYSILRDSKTYAISPVLSTANRAEADLDGNGVPTDSNVENWGSVYYDNDKAGDFYLSSSIPTDFYKVRIYDKVLTTRELAHNAFVDMAAYAKADLAVYEGLDDESKVLVEDAMLSLGFAADPLEFAANLVGVIDLYANQVMAEDTLYVTDGLRVLTTAYDGLDTGALASEGTAVSWFNAARKGEQITLKGDGWQRRADDLGGGYYILKQYINMQSAADRLFGIYLLPEMLPEADYSIELIVNPTGIVDIAEDGSYTRYVDSKTTYGIHYENGFMIGPLRCLIFPAIDDGASGRAGLEKRWCYDRANECWNNTSTRNHKATENAWRFTSLHDVVTYSIDYTRLSEAGKGDYVLYNDSERISSIRINENEFVTNDEANNAFQMMVGNPCGVFSVRVYDRVLTDAEKIQNHAADIIYYYNLNTDLLDQVLPYFSDDPTVVFRGLSELSFDMPRDQAQDIFDARLSALWLAFENVGVRNDSSDGLRYYFTLDENTATAMINAGFDIEIGAIVNVGQNAIPTLDGYNYDYKIVAYDNIGGRNTGFFVDKDTFAVTVQAGSSNKQAMLSKLNVRGYIRLTDASGKDMYFYVDAVGDEYTPDSFFSIYNHMMGNADVAADAALADRLFAVADNCYEREYVYLAAGAPAGGNGTKDAPYNDFETAFAAAKTKLPGINVPTYLYLQAADGVYEVDSLVTIDGAEIPYEYSRFVITSENGKGTLTSTKKLNNSDFVEMEGNVWTYQFEPDENGEYPAFRYLYVDGSIADPSHNGANNFYTADETRYMTKFHRWAITPWLNARYMWEAGQLTTTTLYYPEVKVDLNSQFAYYRDQYLVYEEIFYTGTALTPMTETTAENVSSYYLIRYEEAKYNKLAAEEINALYNSLKQNSEQLAEALKLYKSTHTKDKLLAADKAAYDKAFAAYTAALEQYEEGTAEYEAAVAAHEAALAAYQAADAHAETSLEEYTAVLDKIGKTVINAIAKDETVSSALQPYVLNNPTLSYPTTTLFKTLDDVEKNWPVAPSSGVFAQVTELRANGNLTHESLPYVGDAHLAQELQFFYYRDAYLALDEVNALTAETLNFEATPAVEAGSDQYKSLFYQFLYTKIAVAELAEATFNFATKNAAGTTITAYNKAPVATYTTKYENAPEMYVALLEEIRNSQVITNPTKFEDYSAYLPVVNEASGPYEGKIPSTSPLDQHKAYFNVELVGDQSFAIEQGRAKLVSTAMSIMEEALGKYQEAYDALVAAQAKYEELVASGDKAAASAYADTLSKARSTAKEQYTACLEQIELASRYLSDETDEAFILDGAGMQLAMPTEWTYNFLGITGVDYDDCIIQNGETHVAIYFDPDWYPFSLNNEGHWYNRMASFLSSTAYLDKNNEFYYHQEAGKLYYYNENGIDGLQFEYPTMNNMFYLTNIANVIFENIAFTGLDYNYLDVGFTGGQASSESHQNVVGEKDVMPSGAAIYGTMIYGLTVRGCNFHDLACEGVSLRGRIENSVVEGSTFTNIGSGAIRFGSAAGWSQVLGSENCKITNNYLDGIALILFSSPAITTTYAKDLDVSYNTIRNTSYSGLSIGWNWSWGSFMYGEGVKLMHVNIHHNYIESVMQQMGDGGHIYTLGGNAVKEEHYLFNWCHDNYLVFTNRTGDGEGRFHAANYHDGSSSNWETYNTVVVAHSFGASGPTTADGGGNNYKTVEEIIDEAFFEIVDTEFTMDEYQRRLRKNHNSCWAYYEQTLDSAQAFNITLRDNYLINTRSTQTTGTAQGSQFYEAYRTGVTAEDFIFVENMTYIGDPSRLPVEVEDIIYEAGCEWAKADPFDIADNNY